DLELVARIKAILRRSEQRPHDEILAAGDVVLRRDAREVSVEGETLELTGKEFDLLACFLENPGIVLSRERLLDIVWGMTYPGGTRTVDVHVEQLRPFLARQHERAAVPSLREPPAYLPAHALANLVAGRAARGTVHLDGRDFLYAAEPLPPHKALILLRSKHLAAADWTPFVEG